MTASMRIAHCLAGSFLLLQPSMIASTICYFGADLDQAKAKDEAKDIGDKFAAQGAKTSLGSNIAADKIFDTMKTAAGNCYDAVTGKFKCDGGVMFIYISAHGGYTADHKDTIIANPAKEGNTKVSELAASIAGTIPECCVLVFAFDACAADGWYNEYIDAVGDADNPKNPFKNLNWVVATPKITNGRCIGTPVGDAIKAGFDKKRTVDEYKDYLGSQPGVVVRSGLDEKHAAYTLISPPSPPPPPPPDGNPLPEPGTDLLIGTALFALGATPRVRSKLRQLAGACPTKSCARPTGCAARDCHAGDRAGV